MVRKFSTVAVAAMLAAGASPVGAASVVLSGTSGSSCTYSTVAFAADGTMTVTCAGGGGGPTAQTINFGSAPTIAVSGTGSVSATATSGLPVTFSSTTPSICTIPGSTSPSPVTVNGIAAGSCVVAANQSGNGSYSAAPQATQSFSIGGGGGGPDCSGVPAPDVTDTIGRVGFSGVFNVSGKPNGYAVVAIGFSLAQRSGAGAFNFEDAVGPGSFRGMTVALSTCPGDFTGKGVIQGTLWSSNGIGCIRTNAMNYEVSNSQTLFCSLPPAVTNGAAVTYYLNVKTTEPGLDYRFQLQQTLPQ